MSQILVVDDEVGIRELLSEILSDEGYQVRLAHNADEARRQRARGRPDLVLLDIWMPDTDGITLLREWATKGQLTMPVVMMSGHGTIETAVEATRIGAYGFLEKPIALQKLLSTVGKALSDTTVRDTSAAPYSLAVLGTAPVIEELKARLERARELRSPVLLVAEPGSGEALCARYLHRANTQWMAPEDTVFLSDPNALGRLGEGTMFLPGVEDLAPERQRSLLAALPALQASNVRLVTTARPDLAERVAAGQFDSRLYAGISGVILRVPPLRDHTDDIPEIAGLLLTRLAEAKETPVRTFSTAALNALRMHPWPGNLAQLESVVRSAALVASGPEIRPADVASALGKADQLEPPSLGGLPLDVELRVARDAFEKAYFEYHIAREGGNMSRVAEKVGLERTHLYRKLKQLGIGLTKRGDARNDPDS